MNLPWRTIAMAGLGGATVLLCALSPQAAPGDHAGVELALPERVPGMVSAPVEMSAAEREILPADTGYVRRVYRGEPERGVATELTCTIVLSASDRRSLHRPEVCLPAQGWTIDGAEVVAVDMGTRPDLAVKKLGLSRVVDRPGGDPVTVKAVYLYWYVGRDRTTPSTVERVLLSAYDNVVRNVNHRWAYVSVMSLVTASYDPAGRGDEETMDFLRAFIRESVPRLER